MVRGDSMIAPDMRLVSQGRTTTGQKSPVAAAGSPIRNLT
jgi:hypothetical protein